LNNSILVAWNESMSSRAALDYLVSFAMCPENVQITLLHVFRKASASEELMGKTFTKEEEKRLLDLLKETKAFLIEKGFPPDNIRIVMSQEPYPTIADGIIDYYKKGKYDMVLIGRKRMSKAEEFVMGDISIRLVRALEAGAVLVIKSR
jgi:hypothetical protein